MNIVTCLCDVWWVWSFFPSEKHVIICACCSLLAQFLHLKQTMFKILTCKIEPDEKQRTHTIEKKNDSKKLPLWLIWLPLAIVKSSDDKAVE